MTAFKTVAEYQSFVRDTDDLADQMLAATLYECNHDKDKRAVLISRILSSAVSEMTDINLLMGIMEAQVTVANAIIARISSPAGSA